MLYGLKINLLTSYESSQPGELTVGNSNSVELLC